MISYKQHHNRMEQYLPNCERKLFLYPVKTLIKYEDKIETFSYMKVLKILSPTQRLRKVLEMCFIKMRE